MSTIKSVDGTDAGLAGHWPLRNGIESAISGMPALTVRGAVAFDQAAVLDGRGSYFELHGADDLLDSPAFTVAARVWIDADSPGTIGSIAGRFDPHTRTGFDLSVVDHGGVTSASSNYRNLSFSIDSGTQPVWTDTGRPGLAVHICALTVCNGALYAATFEHHDEGIGRVFRYAAGAGWVDTRLPCSANCVFSLAAIDETLYAASGRYDPRNSAMADTGNMDEQCRVWRMEPGGAWIDCGIPTDRYEDLYNLGIYRGRLYATGSFHPGLYRYEGDRQWTRCADAPPRFLSLAQWRGHLYGASNKGLRRLGPPPEREIIFTPLPDADGVYRYDDAANQWTGCGAIPSETQMYGFCAHRGELFVGTWPSCKVFRSATGIGWHDCGQFHPDEKEVMAMVVYNGMMYAGTLPAADIYRYDSDHHWTRVGNIDATPGVKYRRAWSMAVHDGQLFAGALPTGHVHAMRTGAVATDSRQLATGWHSVAAVRDGAAIRLYLDGRLCGQATSEAVLNLSNGLPLQVGFGQHDYFNGKLTDLRLYRSALNASQIGQLHRSPSGTA